MKKLLLLLVAAMAAQVTFAGIVRMSLAEAIRTKAVTIDAVNIKGNYQGPTTRISLTSLRKDLIEIKIDLGTLLKPDSSKYQPLVLAGEEILVLQPMKKGDLVVQTFCANSHKACPTSMHHYAYNGMVSDTLVNILKFIKANSLFDYLGQTVVWTVLNGHDLSNVYDETRPELSLQLLLMLVKTTGRPMPEYYTLNEHPTQIPGAPAYVPKPLKILATFRIALEAPKTMTLGVYNDKGEEIKSVFENKEFLRNGHEFEVEFEASNVPAGKYYIRLSEGATVLQEKAVTVE